MLVSLNWLKDYVSFENVSAEELAEKITRAGIEVEGIHKLADATNIVVGHVLTRVDHPDSDKLSLCEVNVGEETLQIVCGAPNVDANQKVLVAKVGAVLPNDFKIKAATVRGQESNGMICSLQELGIESKFVDEAYKDGIYVLSETAPIGVDGIEYLMYQDTILELGLTPNRADALNMIGVAYEVSAILDVAVKLPEFELEESDQKIEDLLSLRVESDNCPNYYTRIIQNVEVKPSPQFMQARLMAAGIRPINNIVDIGNYVMLEYGQPLHAFDYDKLGKEILVRQARDLEEVTTLDGVVRVLTENNLLITNGEKPMVIAGVMGASDPEVDTTSRNIVIESALFDSQSIRMTSKELNLRSDSSARFEKGIDSNRTKIALDRAAYLMKKYAGGDIVSGVLGHETLVKEPLDITISKDKINSVLGMNLSIEEIQSTFRRLKLESTVTNNEFVVTAPTRRMDLLIEEDLIEEVGRIYGYDALHAKLPLGDVKQGTYSKSYEFRKYIRQMMNGMGLDQTITYSLVPSSYLSQFTLDEVSTVELAMPLSEDRKVMRYSLIPSLLDVVAYNRARKSEDVRIFEIGSSYFMDGQPREMLKLTAALSGNVVSSEWQGLRQPVDFYYTKGIVETLLVQLGLSNRYSFRVPSELPKEFHPTRTAEVLVGRDVVGYLGQVNPNHSKTPVYVFELNLDVLMKQKVRLIKYKEINKFPRMQKDVAIIVDQTVTSEQVKNVIMKAGGKDLVQAEVFDVYVGQNVEEGKKSLAFKLTYENNQRTLTDDEVMASFKNVINAVLDKLNATVRGS